MDLTGVLLRAGAARPHVLAVTMPGATAVRLAAEDYLRRRGWPEAMTPADADILLTCGDPADPMAAAVSETWQAMPAPRTRATAARPAEVAEALEEARARLTDRDAQRALAPVGTRGALLRHGRARQADHGDMAGMDMGGMHMDMAAGPVRGLPMAHQGDDRDGLRLDRLHVPLGPVLPDWPAGLVVRLTLQGDVVQQAEPEVLGGGGGSFWDEPWRGAAAGEHVAAGDAARRRAAAHLDSLGRFLSLAGWGAAAQAARRLRDELMAGVPAGRLRPDARRFARRVGGSRTLAWLTAGLGELSAGDAAAAGAGPRPAGDVTARYRRWCADLEAAVSALEDASPLRPGDLEPPRGPAADGSAPSAGMLALLPGLLAGTELAAARLIVASLDPDLDELPARAAASHDL
ncbi:MAG TPA: hypothetical protein VGS06_42400 [Streptosporangiaceae bacterium]|nr:hypothetical protein [Streptosporangiaceae bacterium]